MDDQRTPRHVMKWDELKGELDSYFNEMHANMIIELSSYTFHDSILSPVRHQGLETGLCSFVACISCLEMIGRLNKVIRREDYFRLDDVIDNIFVVGHRDQLRWRDIRGSQYGSSIRKVLDYAKKYGLLKDSECRNPDTRNTFSFYCREVSRFKLTSFAQLQRDDVIECLKVTPILATIHSYASLAIYKKVYYEGPSQEDIERFEVRRICHHSVVVVGYVTLKDGSDRLIIQNSYGEEANFKGYVVLPFNDRIFVRFWLPHRLTKCSSEIELKERKEAALTKRKERALKRAGWTVLVASSILLVGIVIKKRYY